MLKAFLKYDVLKEYPKGNTLILKAIIDGWGGSEVNAYTLSTVDGDEQSSDKVVFYMDLDESYGEESLVFSFNKFAFSRLTDRNDSDSVERAKNFSEILKKTVPKSDAFLKMEDYLKALSDFVNIIVSSNSGITVATLNLSEYKSTSRGMFTVEGLTDLVEDLKKHNISELSRELSLLESYNHMYMRNMEMSGNPFYDLAELNRKLLDTLELERDNHVPDKASFGQIYSELIHPYTTAINKVTEFLNDKIEIGSFNNEVPLDIISELAKGITTKMITYADDLTVKDNTDLINTLEKALKKQQEALNKEALFHQNNLTDTEKKARAEIEERERRLKESKKLDFQNVVATIKSDPNNDSYFKDTDSIKNERG